jgi:hypothetical protein
MVSWNHTEVLGGVRRSERNTRSLRAIKLAMKCISLLRKDIDNPGKYVSDTAMAAVANIACAEASPLLSYQW